MTDLVLAIDGGGSKTLLAVIDRAGHLVHSAEAGGSNPQDNPHWAGTFLELVETLGPLRRRIAGSVVAIGGYRESEALDRTVDATIETIFGALEPALDNDVFIAHDAAFLGRPGALLIAGTGSMLVARGCSGELHRVGGWGNILGDEGSAFWLGREALGCVTRTLDGRASAEALTEAVLESLGTTRARAHGAILDWLGKLTHLRSGIAALAPLVTQLADEGDPAARMLLDGAVTHLAAHVETGRRAAGLGDDGAWSLLGGLANSPLIRRDLIHRLGPISDPALPPVGGAAWRAARTAGWSVDESWLTTLKSALRQGALELRATGSAA